MTPAATIMNSCWMALQAEGSCHTVCAYVTLSQTKVAAAHANPIPAAWPPQPTHHS
eukprot:CAMPEP_0202881578 /NCGR_PEP_ID=MMETSP1391-20130828/36732_1 /ASSEMBLY_ACC=CAM_ASM_000867 /TAXON_ID=1034604 /ORGANISM="Chlamydomonas leiostraca, Strain SAG 11-49" /LENGTH=55 /DNA_ID=CAMNT_0049564285 /DNA_START=1 /DNA_END=165 /DNA_ORIENTATION=-